MQAFIRSGLDAGNQYTTTVKPTQWAWNECHITDCSTRVQVPYPYCMYDCVGTNYCSVNSEYPISTAQLRAWIRAPILEGILHLHSHAPCISCDEALKLELLIMLPFRSAS